MSAVSLVHEVDPRLREQLQKLSEQSDAMASSIKAADVGRLWQNGSLGGWNGDPTDRDSLGKAFDRSAIGSLYAAVHAPDGNATAGDAKALRVQLDRLIQMDRAARIRYSTPARAAIVAAGRRSLHGSGGSLTAVTLKHCQDLPIYPTENA